jgi:hypothetical protein
MPSGPKYLPWSEAAPPDLLNQAAAVLAHEAARLPAMLGERAPGAAGSAPAPELSRAGEGLAGLTCPVVGARVPAPGAPPADLRQQAHELLAGLFGALGQGEAPQVAHARQAYGDARCPVTQASPAPLGFDKDALRRQAHEFIDTLLVTFRQATSEDGVVAENKVPLLQCAAPTQPGKTARASLTVQNEEPSPSQITLYCSNFVSDSGHEIPALRVSFAPRVATIAAKAQAVFEIKIAVPAQSPAGTYSGLVQAMGSKYVKAVLSLEVL